MKRLVILAFVAFLSTSAIALHKFYVSVTVIEYVEEKKALQIISKIFIDDIEKLLQERYDETIKLAEKDDESAINPYIERYLKEKLLINVNGKPVAFSFLGKEYENDIMVCYLEAENVEPISNMEIESKVLYNLFPEQENIVRTKINGKHKSFILIKENPKGMLNFN